MHTLRVQRPKGVHSTPYEDPSPVEASLRDENVMFLARVTGSVVSTQKVESMTGHKLLTVEPLHLSPAQRDRLVGTGRTFVCVDPSAPAWGKWS